MIKLDIQQIIYLHEMVIENSGGIKGIRKEELLDSAINVAFQTVNGEDIFTTDEEKIARTAWGLVNNHPFIDGNKRIGILVMLILIKLVNIELVYTQKELIKVGIELAEGYISYELLLDWINCHKMKV